MNRARADQESVSLLWTGGWDSTFQLLQLLIVQRRRVTPFYLIDAERRSTGVEIRTIKRIKDTLLAQYPYAAELLQPTRYFAAADISPDPASTAAFQAILERSPIGSQYEWLSRFCRQNGVPDIQLCIHRDDKAHAAVEKVVTEVTDGAESVFRVGVGFRDTNEWTLFHYFSFPIFMLTKVQMSATASEKGWGPIMGMTWFCYNPTGSGQPCGKCSPCLYTLEEGLGWRFPLRTRMVSSCLRHVIWPVKSRTKQMLRRLGLGRSGRRTA